MKDQHRPYKYIDTDKGLADLIELMLSAGRIAIDIEADSLHHYYEKVCLIQLTIRSKNFIVDPLAKLDLTSFLNILASKSLILHDAGYDLRMLRSSFGFTTEADVFDTMLAAQLLGYEKLGLVALIQDLCNVTLSKHDQKSNWSKRPLTLAQLQYASDDTFYLHEIAEILHSRLKKLNRLHWHQQACKKMISSAELEKPPADPNTVWRIKGSSHLDRHQLTLLKAIWYWRDQQARAADLPPFKIMGNQTVMNIIQFATQNPDSTLADGPSLPRTCSGKRLKLLTRSIKEALSTQPSKYEMFKERKKANRSLPDTQAIAESLHSACQEIAEKLDVTPQLIATRAMIAAISNNRPKTVEEIVECSTMMHWQAELMLPSIQETLQKHERK